MDAVRKWITRWRLPLLIGLGALVCGVAVLAAVLLAPKQRVLRAVERTVAAAEARRDTDLDRLGLPLAQVGEGAVQQLWYLGAPPGPLVPDSGVSSEIGIAAALRSDLPAGQFSVDLSVQAGRVPVAQAFVQGREDLLSLRVPGIAMGSYGVRTGTLGADWNPSTLAEMTGIVLDEAVSFSLVDLARQPQRPEDGTYARLRALCGGLLGQMEAESRGGGEYAFSIPAQAVGDFLTAAAEALREDPAANLGRAAAQMGAEWLPGELAALLDSGWQAAGALEALGAAPLEGRVWLQSGRVQRMALMLPVDGGEATAELGFGPGNDLLDGFTLRLQAGGAALDLQLTGGAAGREGLLDRALSASMERDGERYALTAALQVDRGGPAGGTMALEAAWQAPGAEAALWMAGGVVAGGTTGTMDVLLDDCRLALDGLEQPFTAEYSLSPLRGSAFGEVDPAMLLELSQSQLEKLAEGLD